MRLALPISLFALLAGIWLILVSREPPKAPPAPSEPQPPRAMPSLREALIEQGRSLAPAVAEQIRQELKEGAGDSRQRALLMAWLWRRGGAPSVLERTQHLLWFIANQPASDFLDWPPAWFAPEELGPFRMEEILAAWRNAVRAHPEEPRVAWSAARWYERHDAQHVVEFLKASLEAQPDFGPAAEKLAEWCVRQIALQGAEAPQARKLLAASLNPEIQMRAARRFHQLSEAETEDHARRGELRRQARRCFLKARAVLPYLREEDVFSTANREAPAMQDIGQQSAAEIRALLNAGRRQLKRLPIEAFPSLPPAIAATLKRMGCTIPQAFASPVRQGPHNVIQGRFYDPQRESWAVLCSVRETVRLLVFEDAGDRTPETLQGGLESSWMQTIGENAAGFSWAITVAGEPVIHRYNREFQGPPLPPIDHDGIESHFLGKASVILYRHQGRWLGLQGAD